MCEHEGLPCLRVCKCECMNCMFPDRIVYVCLRCHNLDGDIWCAECKGNYCQGCYFLDPHRDEGLEVTT